MIPKFKLGDSVRKINGARWQGSIVGTYSTSLTPEGYCVESNTEIGSVQIYPAKALNYSPNDPNRNPNMNYTPLKPGDIRQAGDEQQMIDSLGNSNESCPRKPQRSEPGIWKPICLLNHTILASDLMHLNFRRPPASARLWLPTKSTRPHKRNRTWFT